MKPYAAISRGDGGFPPVDVEFSYAYGKRPRWVRVEGANNGLSHALELAEVAYEAKSGDYVAHGRWRWAQA